MVVNPYPYRCIVDSVTNEMTQWLRANIDFDNYVWGAVSSDQGKVQSIIMFTLQEDYAKFVLTWT